MGIDSSTQVLTWPTPPPESVPISRRALIQRLQRRLRRKGLTLRRMRGLSEKAMGAKWVVFDGQHNIVASGDLLDDDSAAITLGVLRPGETLCQ